MRVVHTREDGVSLVEADVEDEDVAVFGVVRDRHVITAVGVGGLAAGATVVAAVVLRQVEHGVTPASGFLVPGPMFVDHRRTQRSKQRLHGVPDSRRDSNIARGRGHRCMLRIRVKGAVVVGVLGVRRRTWVDVHSTWRCRPAARNSVVVRSRHRVSGQRRSTAGIVDFTLCRTPASSRTFSTQVPATIGRDAAPHEYRGHDTRCGPHSVGAEPAILLGYSYGLALGFAYALMFRDTTAQFMLESNVGRAH
jgi:hypothetical protein